ncbi:multiprotein-bridging factor 1 family protein [Streptomyces sp. NPDC001633]|uniref:helix-turn-helix domain-containing protein n=1 Tax=Streptomyces sp. NPDC001633 TaxID=3364595 RepID=UPI0036C42619
MTELPGDEMRNDKFPAAYTTGRWPSDAAAPTTAPPGVHYSLTLARELHRTIRAKGISQRAASQLAGLNPTAVGRILRGECYPNLSSIARLEVALQTPLLTPGLYRTAPAITPQGE